MEKTELTVSMEPERLDALRYFLAAKNKRTPQKELQRALEVRGLCSGGAPGLPGRPVPAGPGQASAAGGIQGHTDAEGGSGTWRPLN